MGQDPGSRAKNLLNRHVRRSPGVVGRRSLTHKNKARVEHLWAALAAVYWSIYIDIDVYVYT